MTLVPAVMALLGHKAWWLPHVLQRILPAISRTARRCRKSPNTTRRKRWLCRSPSTASGTQASLRYLGGQPPQRAAACPALPQLLGSAVSSLRHHAPQARRGGGGLPGAAASRITRRSAELRAARFSLARRTSGTATAPTDITAARARSTRGGSPGDISMMAAQPARRVSST
ncbi:hypothetical protein [Streptomyces pseudogriseolus]|uniref:hypothetical protein n=1 Tax=Streptomyces pseudogriseolus TaxID=36817 RepID=UPI003FA204D0